MSEAPDMYRYKVEYVENSFYTTEYGEMFRALKDSAVLIRSVSGSASAKCKDGSSVVKAITLQGRRGGLWT